MSLELNELMKSLMRIGCLILSDFDLEITYICRLIYWFNDLMRVLSHSSKTCDENLGALGLIFAQAREFSLERDPFSLKLESLKKIKFFLLKGWFIKFHVALLRNYLNFYFVYI